ncbi:MAG: 3-phosphoshikimate 1-carboxyvinyltransferase [Bacillota bacterium]|jgi:3-phosphoshikimate 1-carboxyvinyltransferase
MKAHASPSTLEGRLSVPGSKSHTIRAVIISTLSEGRSVFTNPLPSQDCLSAVKVCSAYGARAEVGKDQWTIEGVGRNLVVPSDIVDAGNSGTTFYFVAAMAALLDQWSVLSGDHQIRRRPVRALLRTLEALGATAFTTRRDVDAAPIVVRGPLKAGTVKTSGNFSQFISGPLLVSPMIEGTTRIEVENAKEKPYLQMTVDWMTQHGIKLDYDSKNYSYFEIKGPQKYSNVNARIPSDWESVAFPLVAAAVTDSKLTIDDLDLDGNQGDAAIVDVLQEMGANIQVDHAHNSLTVTGGSKLHGITVNCSDIPDALPILSVAACFAEGTTKLTGVEMVRAKETDRVAVMHQELAKMGAHIEETHDSMTIHGGHQLTGAVVSSHDDHRVAMSLAVAGLFAKGKTVVNDAQCVSVSFPGFFEIMNRVGAGFVTED